MLPTEFRIAARAADHLVIAAFGCCGCRHFVLPLRFAGSVPQLRDGFLALIRIGHAVDHRGSSIDLLPFSSAGGRDLARLDGGRFRRFLSADRAAERGKCGGVIGSAPEPIRVAPAVAGSGDLRICRIVAAVAVVIRIPARFRAGRGLRFMVDQVVAQGRNHLLLHIRIGLPVENYRGGEGFFSGSGAVRSCLGGSDRSADVLGIPTDPAGEDRQRGSVIRSPGPDRIPVFVGQLVDRLVFGLGLKGLILELRRVYRSALCRAGGLKDDIPGGVCGLGFLMTGIIAADPGRGHRPVVIGPDVFRFAPVMAGSRNGYRLGLLVFVFIRAVCRGNSGRVHGGSLRRAGRVRCDRSHDGVDRFGGTIGTGVVRDSRSVAARIAAGPGEALEGVGYRLRRSLILDEEVDRGRARIRKAGGGDILLCEGAGRAAAQIILIRTGSIRITIGGIGILEEPQQILPIRLVMPELAGVAGGRLVTADPEAAAGCRIQIAAALLQPCADRAAGAGLELAGKRCFRGICCRKGDLAARDSRGDPDQCGIATGNGGGVGNDVDGSGIAVDDDILLAIDKGIRLDIGHTVTGRRIDGRRTATDRQMDGPLSIVVILDCDIHVACSQTLYRDRTGFAGCNVDRRIALDLRDAAVAERCGKVVGSAGGTVCHRNDQRFACSDRGRLFGITGLGGDTDRAA